jgi:sugar phosphate isomerase/epimerase
MERRDFLKTMGVGAIAMAVGNELFASCSNKATEQLPSFGLISGSNGQWHADGPKEGLKKIAEWGYTELEGGGIRGMETGEYLSFLKSIGLVPMVGSANIQSLIGDESELKANLERARNLGQQYVACYWPWPGDPGQKIDDWKVVADNLNRGGRICHSQGIQLVYHNHDMEFYPVEGHIPFDVLLPLLDPVVGIELDLYWITKGGKSAVEYLKKYPGRYPVLHLKDMPADVKCGVAPIDFSTLTEKDFAPIGSGVVPFPEIFKTNSISGAKHFIVEADKPPGGEAQFLELSGKYLRSLRY